MVKDIDLREAELAKAYAGRTCLGFVSGMVVSMLRQNLAEMFRQGRKAWLGCTDADERQALALSMGTLAVYAGRCGIVRPMSQIKLCQWVATWA